jgi:hypothetical protein
MSSTSDVEAELARMKAGGGAVTAGEQPKAIDASGTEPVAAESEPVSEPVERKDEA